MVRHVYRIGSHHNRWVVTIPGNEPTHDIDHDLPLIHKRLEELHGKFAAKSFDYIEFLGAEVDDAQR